MPALRQLFRRRGEQLGREPLPLRDSLGFQRNRLHGNLDALEPSFEGRIAVRGYLLLGRRPVQPHVHERNRSAKSAECADDCNECCTWIHAISPKVARPERSTEYMTRGSRCGLRVAPLGPGVPSPGATPPHACPTGSMERQNGAVVGSRGIEALLHDPGPDMGSQLRCVRV